MKKKFLARLTTGLLLSIMTTGLLIFSMAGMASATQYFPTPSIVGDIDGDGTDGIDGPVTYNFDFSGLAAVDEFTTGALFIRETDAAFNTAEQNVNVNIDGVNFGTHYFADDGAPINRTLQLAVPLSYTDLFYIANNGEAALSLTTSKAVSGAFFIDGVEFDLTPPSGTIDVWLDYEIDADAPTPTYFPEPTGVDQDNVSFFTEEFGPIDGPVKYEYDIDGLPAPAPFLDGHLFISETDAAFNTAEQNVNVNIDGIDFGAHYFADDGAPINRTLQLEVGLGFTDLFYITSDKKAHIALTTSEAVSGAFYLNGEGVEIDLTEPSGSMYAALVYHPTPEPTTMLLFGFGLLGLAGVSRRKK